MVSNSPIPFAAITRQSGTQQAQTVPADAVYANDIDANFTRINTWLDSTPMTWWTAGQVSASVMDFYSGFTSAPTNAVNFGYLQQDLRFLCIRAKWTGGNVTADANGGVGSKMIGTLIQLFISGPTSPPVVNMPCQVNSTPGTVAIGNMGQIWLVNLSYGGQVLATNAIVSITHTYIVRGSR